MVRVTRQKRMLVEEIKKFSSFFSAEDLYKKVRPIGVATVYRFLKSLEKKGEIHSYTCNGTKVYSQSKDNHAHFHCERCRKTTHIDIKKIDFIIGNVCHFQLDVTGICEVCLAHPSNQ